MELIAFLKARLDEDERAARAASGNTVIGEQGNWAPSLDGDEWEAHRSDDIDELLVALRPGLPRPPDVMSGLWGAIVYDDPAFSQEPGAGRPLPCFEHAARHDPARVLRRIAADRRRLERHAPEMMLARDSDENDHTTWVPGCSTCQTTVVHPGDWPCDELRDMLAEYADHPDYREEWRP